MLNFISTFTWATFISSHVRPIGQAHMSYCSLPTITHSNSQKKKKHTHTLHAWLKRFFFCLIGTIRRRNSKTGIGPFVNVEMASTSVPRMNGRTSVCHDTLGCSSLVRRSQCRPSRTWTSTMPRVRTSHADHIVRPPPHEDEHHVAACINEPAPPACGQRALPGSTPPAFEQRVGHGPVRPSPRPLPRSDNKIYRSDMRIY